MRIPAFCLSRFYSFCPAAFYLLAAGFFVVMTVSESAAGLLFRENFDTPISKNTQVFDVRSSDHRISKGNLVLSYTNTPNSPPNGIECTLPVSPIDPAEREITLHMGGGGAEMSNSLFVCYALAPGSGLALPPFGYGSLANSRTGDRSGYMIRFLRHGDGTNEVLFYRNDAGWVNLLHNEWLPANPVTTLRRVVIRHRKDGVHIITAAFDTGVIFERAFSFEDNRYPPDNIHRRLQIIAKAHAGLRAKLQFLSDTWIVTDRSRPSPSPGVVRRKTPPPKPLWKPWPLSRKRDAVKEMDRAWQAYRENDTNQARAGCLRVLAQDRNNADAIDLLGLLEMSQLKLSDAHLHIRQALNLRMKKYAPEHPKVAQSLYHLGELYSWKDAAQAESFFKESLAVREKIFGRDHWELIESLNGLAQLHQQWDRHDAAERLLRRALAIAQDSYGPEHPATAAELIHLARLSDDRGRKSEAEPLYLRALSIMEKAAGPDDPQVVSILHFLEALYQKEKRDGELEPIYRRLAAVSEKTMGPNHPEVARRLLNLGMLYSSSNPDEAERLIRRALEITEKSQGLDHPFMAAGLYNLAQLRHVRGDREEAERLYKRALAIREKELDPAPLKLSNLIERLATLYLDQSRYSDAEPLLVRALELKEKALGLNDPKLESIVKNLAFVYKQLGRAAEAEYFKDRLKAIKKGE